MTKKDEFSSFKIADVRRPEVRSTQAKGGKDAVEEEAPISVGFPTIEARLMAGSIDDVAEALRPSYEKLEALASSGGMREKAAAKKAMGAYERTADMLEYLFETKETLRSGSDS